MDKIKVSVGDIVSLNIQYDNVETEDVVVKLVERNPNLEREDIEEISVDSPVGSAILNKEIGMTVKCFVLDKSMNRVTQKEINIKVTDIQKSEDMKKDKVKSL